MSLSYEYGRPERTQYRDKPTVAAEKIVGPVDWISSDTGFLECPGKENHSTRNGEKDCRITLDGAPTLHCFHDGCGPVIQSLNAALRRTILSENFSGYCRPKPYNRAPNQQEKIARRAEKALPGILEKYSVPLEDSPTKLAGDVKGETLQWLKLFRDDDVLWIGNTTDSGSDDRCRNHFVPVWHWQRRLSGLVPHPDFRLTCPSVFKPGSRHRSNDSVLEKRFLVVESDTLTREQTTAVFQWLRELLPLRAVVSTGNKSVHGWFTYPHPTQLAELKVVLPKLGCDSKMFTPSQPCRRPGGLRENGNYQRLLWLNLERNS